MQRGFELFDRPKWSAGLTSLYWHIRVEGRDKAKRRKYYRYVAKEKLRLAELGIDQELIEAVCRYLCRMDRSSGERMLQLMQQARPQLAFKFHFR